MKLVIKETLVSAISLLVFAVGSASAQTMPPSAADRTEQPQPEIAQAAPATPQTPMPAIHSLRDIDLGMTVDEVREKLGKPDVRDDTGLVFNLDNGDTVQIGLDTDKKVRTIAVIYAAGSKEAPSLMDIFGADARQPEGDAYKMERYPDAGYWVSYSRTNSKDKPVVIVTLRKIF